LNGYPVSLALAGLRVVVVGGGRVATRRVADLLETGAHVTVVAPAVSAEIIAQAGAPRLEIRPRVFEPADLDGAWLVFSATGDPGVEADVVAAARERRCLVSSASAAPGVTFRPMAVLRRGDLEVAVGTSGRSPAMARWLKTELESQVGPEYGTLLELAAEARAEAAGSGERPDWSYALNSGILALIRTGSIAQAREGLRTCLSSSSD
jgi:precorrin-2 dehydrogenase/sirohydrochlorin ferrochelatase